MRPAARKASEAEGERSGRFSRAGPLISAGAK
jgi:hypothetical protein